MVKCTNIVNIFNKLYDKKEHNVKDCLKKNHKYMADTIKLKLPNTKMITLNISKNDNIYNPLSFVLSNINKKKYKDVNENKYAFMALLLILAIIEDYRIINIETNKILSDKKIIDRILPYIQMDEYIISVPHKIQYNFKVSGFKLAIMKVKKLE